MYIRDAFVFVGVPFQHTWTTIRICLVIESGWILVVMLRLERRRSRIHRCRLLLISWKRTRSPPAVEQGHITASKICESVSPATALFTSSDTVPHIDPRGDSIADPVGEPVGNSVGLEVGAPVGVKVGDAVGDPVDPAGRAHSQSLGP